MLEHLYKKEIENTVLVSFVFENEDFFKTSNKKEEWVDKTPIKKQQV